MLTPGQDERTLYTEYWQRKLRNKENIDFPKSLCRPIARLMDDFSFAYMQEGFVATLLVLARREDDDEEDDMAGRTDSDDDDLERYEFYRVMKDQVALLREDMDSSSDAAPTQPTTCSQVYVPEEHHAPGPQQAGGHGSSSLASDMRQLSLGRQTSADGPFEPLAAAREEGRLAGHFGGLRRAGLTAENAMSGLRKTRKLNDGVWEYGSS